MSQKWTHREWVEFHPGVRVSTFGFGSTTLFVGRVTFLFRCPSISSSHFRCCRRKNRGSLCYHPNSIRQ